MTGSADLVGMDIRRWWRERCTPPHPLWLGREEAFSVMASAGMRVIDHTRTPLQESWTDVTGLLVAYTDEAAHAGDAKQRCSPDEAALLPPGTLVSRFVPPGGVSYRLLAVGTRRFALKYTSPEWRSNGGPEGEIELRVLPEVPGAGRWPQVPGWPGVIWAVDFVAEHGELLALDLNPAPGIQGTGVMSHLAGFSLTGELARYHTLTGDAFWLRP